MGLPAMEQQNCCATAHHQLAATFRELIEISL
jgi:hypothetical protein